MIDKFKTLTGHASTKLPPFVKSKDLLDLCVVYCVWNERRYLDVLTISLTTQILHTDFNRIYVKLFVSADLFEEAVARFGGYLDIIRMDKFNKYTITLHPSLQNFKKIAICDCDTFFYSLQPVNLYQKLFESEPPILMMLDPEPDALRIFLSRIVLSPLISPELYLNKFVEMLEISKLSLMDILTSYRWYLSCFMVFDRTIFSGEKWKSYVDKCFEMGTYCDETVFLTFARKNNVNIEDLGVIDGIRTVLAMDVKAFVDNPMGLGVLHPLHGDFCHDMELQSVYGEITSKLIL